MKRVINFTFSLLLPRVDADFLCTLCQGAHNLKLSFSVMTKNITSHPCDEQIKLQVCIFQYVSFDVRKERWKVNRMVAGNWTPVDPVYFPAIIIKLRRSVIEIFDIRGYSYFASQLYVQDCKRTMLRHRTSFFSLLVTPDIIHNVSSLRLLARAVGNQLLDDSFQLDTPMLDDGCLCNVSNENDNFILNGCFLFI